MLVELSNQELVLIGAALNSHKDWVKELSGWEPEEVVIAVVSTAELRDKLMGLIEHQ